MTASARLFSTILFALGLGAPGLSFGETPTTPPPAPATTAATTPAADAVPAPGPADPQAMMAAWTEMMKPGPNHANFERAVGNWKTTTRLWMDPKGAPKESHGTCRFELILGGRFMQQSCKGEFLGQPFEGLGLEGYDNYRKKYVSVWLDSSNTAIGSMSGTCTKDGRSCLYHGEMDEPMTGEIAKTVKATFEMPNDKQALFTMFDAAYEGNGWTRVFEIEYRRDE